MATRSISSSRFLISRDTQKSLSFNGSSDYAAAPITPDSSGLNIGFWIFIKEGWTTGVFDRIFDYLSGGNTGTRCLLNGTRRSIDFDCGNGTLLSCQIPTGAIPVGQWVHVIFSNISGQSVAYVNNILSKSTVATYSAPAGQSFTIARISASAASYGNILLKNFTYYNGSAWTSNQRSDLYYKNIIPSGAIQWSMNDVATDQNGANALTLTGTSYSTNVPNHMIARSAATSRFLVRDMGKSIFCKGSYGNPRVKPTDDTVNTIGTTSTYSLSVFVKLFKKTVSGAAPGVDNHCIVSLDFDYASNKGYVLEISNTGAFDIFYGNTENRGADGKFPFGKWVHLAMVVSGTSIFCYVNGVLVDTRTIGRVADAGLTQRMFFAETASSTNRGVLGYVDELWVRKDYVLSLAEIQNICFRGVYPSSPSLFYKCDVTSGNLTDESANANTGLVQDTSHLKVNQTDVFLKNRSAV